MYKVSIVEDEEEAFGVLKKCLEQYSEETGTAFEISWYNSGLKFLSEYKADCSLVFMDIELPDINGIKTSEKLREIDSCVGLVFITNIAKYAIDGYRVNALDYVLKPVTYASLKIKLDRILARLKKADKKIVITSRNEQNVVGVNSVYYVEVSVHNIVYHTESGDYNSYGTLKEVMRDFPADQFIRCNNCYFVNLAHISGFSGSTLQIGPYSIEISRSRKKEVLAAYNKYRLAKNDDMV